MLVAEARPNFIKIAPLRGEMRAPGLRDPLVTQLDRGRGIDILERPSLGSMLERELGRAA